MKQIFAIFALLTLIGAASVAAAQDAKTVSNIDEMLGGIESSPSADEWKKLGDDAPAVLLKIAGDSKQLATRRARATTALKYFPNADTQKGLNDLLNDDKTPMVVRRRAALSLTAFGNDSLPVLETYAAHNDKRLRESVIKALGALKTPESKMLLEARLKVEDREYLKEEIVKSIKLIDAK
jgi:HEAT repeat protein